MFAAASQGGTQHNAVHFEARNFQRLCGIEHVVTRGQQVKGSKSNEDWPHAGQPQSELKARNGHGVKPPLI